VLFLQFHHETGMFTIPAKSSNGASPTLEATPFHWSISHNVSLHPTVSDEVF